MSNKRAVLIGLVLGILGLAILLGVKQVGGIEKDYHLAIITANQIGIVSISPERKLISVLKIDGQTPVWIPGGWGWYRADRIKRILEQEKSKPELWTKILFYNFGFVPDSIFNLQDFDSWDSYGQLLPTVGWWRTLQIKSSLNSWLVNETEIKDNLVGNSELATVLIRDFADNQNIAADARLAVINSSNLKGMADWLSDRLSFNGYTILGTENDASDTQDCLLKASDSLLKQDAFRRLVKLLDCDRKADGSLNNQAELYLGPKYGEMIKYSSYLTE